MKNDNLIRHKDTEKVLENNKFYGFVAKRMPNNRITYTYRSVRWPNVLISVKTMKLDPTKIQSDKIVLGIKFNDTEINGWNEFIEELKNLRKYNTQKI